MSALKFKYKSKEEVPAESQGLYVEREGAWVLDVEGAVERGKLDEFRANNIALSNELAEHRRRFEGIDPEAVRRLEEQQAMASGQMERVVEARVRSARADLERQYSGIAAERDALNGRLTAIQIDQGVIGCATKRGLRASAIPDITGRARAVFRLVDGTPRAYEADGKTVRVGKDGMAPMTLDEWVDLQVADAPHLFEANAGGGGGGATSPFGHGSGGAGNRSVRNPFRKETWNLTEQMKVQRTDPQLAARLRAAA
jgi:hypothetical protein